MANPLGWTRSQGRFPGLCGFPWLSSLRPRVPNLSGALRTPWCGHRQATVAVGGVCGGLRLPCGTFYGGFWNRGWRWEKWRRRLRRPLHGGVAEGKTIVVTTWPSIDHLFFLSVTLLGTNTTGQSSFTIYGGPNRQWIQGHYQEITGALMRVMHRTWEVAVIIGVLPPISPNIPISNLALPPWTLYRGCRCALPGLALSRADRGQLGPKRHTSHVGHHCRSAITASVRHRISTSEHPVPDLLGTLAKGMPSAVVIFLALVPGRIN